MAEIYARNTQAAPLRSLDECLPAIRAGNFFSDLNRSGFFEKEIAGMHKVHLPVADVSAPLSAQAQSEMSGDTSSWDCIADKPSLVEVGKMACKKVVVCVHMMGRFRMLARRNLLHLDLVLPRPHLIVLQHRSQVVARPPIWRNTFFLLFLKLHGVSAAQHGSVARRRHCIFWPQKARTSLSVDELSQVLMSKQKGGRLCFPCVHSAIGASTSSRLHNLYMNLI